MAFTSSTASVGHGRIIGSMISHASLYWVKECFAMALLGSYNTIICFTIFLLNTISSLQPSLASSSSKTFSLRTKIVIRLIKFNDSICDDLLHALTRGRNLANFGLWNTDRFVHP